MAKKETANRVPFNWAKLKKLAESGASIIQMAKATDSHYHSSKSDDKTKPTRARLSIAANKGVRIDGRLVRFKRRARPLTKKSPSKPPTSQSAKKVARLKAVQGTSAINKAQEPNGQ